MRSIKFRCPNPQCRVTLSIPTPMQGQRVKCAGCGESFLVPPSVPSGGRNARNKKGKTAA